MSGAVGRWSAPCRAGVLLAALALAACAAPRPSSEAEGAMARLRDPAMSAQEATRLVTAGASTKADVLAALGPATVVRFDSGYEVWAWRATTAGNPEAGTEFVVLFTPSGVVAKSRIRPPYGRR